MNLSLTFSLFILLGGSFSILIDSLFLNRRISMSDSHLN